MALKPAPPIKSYLTSSPAEQEDTITIAGRQVTISQEPLMKAEVKAARTILQNLQNLQDTRSSMAAKVIES